MYGNKQDMSVVVAATSDRGGDLNSQGSPQSPVRRGPGPKKSVATKLWDVLQPLARLWGLITAIGESANISMSNYLV